MTLSRRFKDGELVVFGGLVFKVRFYKDNSGEFTLDEQYLDIYGTDTRIQDPTKFTLEAVGRFDARGKLVLSPNKLTKDPVISLYEQQVLPLWKKILRKLGFKNV